MRAFHQGVKRAFGARSATRVLRLARRRPPLGGLFAEVLRLDVAEQRLDKCDEVNAQDLRDLLKLDDVDPAVSDFHPPDGGVGHAEAARQVALVHSGVFSGFSQEPAELIVFRGVGGFGHP